MCPLINQIMICTSWSFKAGRKKLNFFCQKRANWDMWWLLCMVIFWLWDHIREISTFCRLKLEGNFTFLKFSKAPKSVPGAVSFLQCWPMSCADRIFFRVLMTQFRADIFFKRVRRRCEKSRYFCASARLLVDTALMKTYCSVSSKSCSRNWFSSVRYFGVSGVAFFRANVNEPVDAQTGLLCALIIVSMPFCRKPFASARRMLM